MVAFATQVKRRRGTTAENNEFTGAEGEIVVDTQKHTLRVHDGLTQGGFEIARTEDINELYQLVLSSVVPAGIVSAFAGTTSPSGWLKCDGSTISRTTYAALFAAIGTKYGAGDGSTTFKLPTLNNGSVPIGMASSYIGATTTGVLPNISGTFAIDGGAGNTSGSNCLTGAFTKGSKTYSNGPLTGTGSGAKSNTQFNASSSNSIYGSGWFSGARVIPAGTGMTYYIKY